jgi:L-amino acid N-acyltransferase YncA/nitroimidazol reductase NimA-like FMN-containing flavoprotein (pyridoxamine 5'-phosphate oxidase superfamily)
MRTWAEFAVAEPALAAAGEELFRAFTVGYLATVRPDGSPRVHPVTVTLHGGGLYISTVRGTRKAYDLRRDGRFALHAFPRFPDESGWHDDEFMVGGRAEEVVDRDERRAVLEVHNDTVSPRDPLWHLLLDRAMRKHRIGGQPRIERWRANPARPRLARPDIGIAPLEPVHWPEVRAILQAGIATGDATLDPEAPDWDRFEEVHRPDGRLVAILGGAVVGWSALSAFSKRDVYSGVAWERVYVAERARGLGVGRALLEHQIASMPRLGLWTMLAGVIRENGRSLALHRRVGFRVIGVQERLGRDGTGRWRDVVLLERRTK